MDERSIWIKNRFFFAVYIGVVAGLIWGGIKIAAYYLGFTKVIPAFLAEPFFGPDGLDSWRGTYARVAVYHHRFASRFYCVCLAFS